MIIPLAIQSDPGEPLPLLNDYNVSSNSQLSLLPVKTVSIEVLSGALLNTTVTSSWVGREC